MSDTKFLAADRGTVTRINKAGSPKQGCGHSQRLYTGRLADWTNRSFLRFALDWTDVGRIVSATLVLYTDDAGFVSGATPRIHVRRLTEDFLNGDNPNGVFDASDYTDPGYAAVSHNSYAMVTTPNAVNRLDITWLFNDWAPKTVIRSTGVPGTGIANHGISLSCPSATDTKLAWRGWSEEWTDSSLRPVIELEYDPAPTAPATPTNLDPSGSIISLEAFEADFTAGRPGDKLAFSEVEVYAANGTTRIWTSGKVRSTDSETVAGRTHLIPSNLVLHADTTYKWRIRQWNSDGLVSAWTSQVSFLVSNTAPSPPVLSPDCAPAASGPLIFPGFDATADDSNNQNRISAFINVTDVPITIRVTINSDDGPSYGYGVWSESLGSDDGNGMSFLAGVFPNSFDVVISTPASDWYIWAYVDGTYDGALSNSGTWEVIP